MRKYLAALAVALGLIGGTAAPAVAHHPAVITQSCVYGAGWTYSNTIKYGNETQRAGAYSRWVADVTNCVAVGITTAEHYDCSSGRCVQIYAHPEHVN